MIRVRPAQKYSRGFSALQALKSQTWPPSIWTTRRIWPARTRKPRPSVLGTTALSIFLSGISASFPASSDPGGGRRGRRLDLGPELLEGQDPPEAPGDVLERRGVEVVAVQAGDAVRDEKR